MQACRASTAYRSGARLHDFAVQGRHVRPDHRRTPLEGDAGLLGEPDYLQDPEYETFMGRFGIADAVLNPLYTELFLTMTMLEAAEECQRRGIVCTPILKPDDVLGTRTSRSGQLRLCRDRCGHQRCWRPVSSGGWRTRRSGRPAPRTR